MGAVREVEVKYRVPAVDVLLGALAARGVELGAPVRQDDQAYAPVGWSYGDSKIGVSFVRLRSVTEDGVAGRHTFTLKRPVENALACLEYETAVADREQMHLAIVAMGFWPTVRIVKVRRAAAVGDLSLCVDEVAGLGTFLELERMVPAGVPGEAVQAELAAFVTSLGVAAERTEETYDSLVRAAFALPDRPFRLGPSGRGGTALGTDEGRRRRRPQSLGTNTPNRTSTTELVHGLRLRPVGPRHARTSGDLGWDLTATRGGELRRLDRPGWTDAGGAPPPGGTCRDRLAGPPACPVWPSRSRRPGRTRRQ